MNKYFLYSREQYQKRLEIESKIGRKYIPGTVIIGGRERRFTEMSDKFNPRFKDAEIVYHGDPKNVKFTMPRCTTLGR